MKNKLRLFGEVVLALALIGFLTGNISVEFFNDGGMFYRLNVVGYPITIINQTEQTADSL